MKILIITIILFFSIPTYCQLPNNNSTKQISERKNSSPEIERLYEEIVSNNTENKTALTELKTDLKAEINEYKQSTRDLLNTYVFLISAGVFIIGFLVTWLGKSAIKKRVEELITETIQKHAEEKIVQTLNSKITNELIEKSIKSKTEKEINDILDAIKKDGAKTIQDLKRKGSEAINQILAAPPIQKQEEENKNLSDLEITENNNQARADEFFKIAYENTKNHRIKLELYKNVLDITPDNYHALNNIAVSHINLNEPFLAIEALDKAIEINKDFIQAYVNRARANNLLNKLEDALIDLEKASAINSNFEFIYSVKGNILTKQGKFDEAEIELNKGVELNQNSPEAHFNRAYFYEERKQYDKSEADYKMAESLGMENKAMLYNNMAVLYRRKKEFDTAIEYLEKARSIDPNYPNIDGTLALIYADKGDDNNFYKYLQLALEKGCPAWNYLHDNGFDKYRDTERLNKILDAYKKKYFA